MCTGRMVKSREQGVESLFLTQVVITGLEPLQVAQKGHPTRPQTDRGHASGASPREKGDGSGSDSSPFHFLLELLLHDGADRSCVANRVGEGTALAEQMRSAEGGRRGLFEVPFKRSSERNEFHSRADERLSAVEPQRLSRQERSARPGVNPLRVRRSRVGE